MAYSGKLMIQGSFLKKCDQLISGNIEIPDSVTYIDAFAFKGCTSLKSIEIPDSVTYIGYGAFSGCIGLTKIEIPDSVKEIEGAAFGGCTGLTSIEIHSSIAKLGEGAFSCCAGLKKIAVNPRNKFCFCQDNVLYNKKRNKLILSANTHTNFQIPNSVTKIEQYAFHSCTDLTSIEIPNSVIRIEQYAFHGCTDLTSIEIPNSVTNIGDRAFSDCSSLTCIVISDSVNEIGNEAFLNSPIQKIVVIEDSGQVKHDIILSKLEWEYKNCSTKPEIVFVDKNVYEQQKGQLNVNTMTEADLYKSQIADLESLVSQLRTENYRINQMMSEYEQQIKTLKAQNESLRHEKSELTDRFQTFSLSCKEELQNNARKALIIDCIVKASKKYDPQDRKTLASFLASVTRNASWISEEIDEAIEMIEFGYQNPDLLNLIKIVEDGII